MVLLSFRLIALTTPKISLIVESFYIDPILVVNVSLGQWGWYVYAQHGNYVCFSVNYIFFLFIEHSYIFYLFYWL